MSRAALPVLELLVDPAVLDPVRPLLVALRLWCEPRVRRANESIGAARLATSATAPGLHDALAHGALPLAVWVGDLAIDSRSDDGLELPPRVRQSATVLLVATPEQAEAVGPRALAIPSPGINAQQHLAVPPFVRARWRQRFGYPSDFVVELEPPRRPQPIPHDLGLASLTLASAAIVSRRWALVALALGTPVVIDGSTAERLGARDGIEVVVAEGTEAVAAAAELARDHRRAAILSRAGRRLVEDRHDVNRLAAELAERLSLRQPPTQPFDRLRERLDEMGTPPFSRVSQRGRASLAGLVGGATAEVADGGRL